MLSLHLNLYDCHFLLFFFRAKFAGLHITMDKQGKEFVYKAVCLKAVLLHFLFFVSDLKPPAIILLVVAFWRALKVTHLCLSRGLQQVLFWCIYRLKPNTWTLLPLNLKPNVTHFKVYLACKTSDVAAVNGVMREGIPLHITRLRKHTLLWMTLMWFSSSQLHLGNLNRSCHTFKVICRLWFDAFYQISKSPYLSQSFTNLCGIF